MDSQPPESHLRPLKSIPEDERKAIWDEATRKAEEEEEFVRWWDETVGVRYAGDTKNADRRSCLSKATAESDTGISQQQVSRWKLNCIVIMLIS